MPIDALTLKSKFDESGKLDYIGGMEYILHVTEQTIIASHSRAYASRVRFCSNRRKEIEILKKGIHLANQGDTATEEVMTQLANLKLEVNKDEPIQSWTEQWLDKCEEGKRGHYNRWWVEWDKVWGLV